VRVSSSAPCPHAGTRARLVGAQSATSSSALRRWSPPRARFAKRPARTLSPPGTDSLSARQALARRSARVVSPAPHVSHPLAARGNPGRGRDAAWRNSMRPTREQRGIARALQLPDDVRGVGGGPATAAFSERPRRPATSPRSGRSRSGLRQESSVAAKQDLLRRPAATIYLVGEPREDAAVSPEAAAKPPAARRSRHRRHGFPRAAPGARRSPRL